MIALRNTTRLLTRIVSLFIPYKCPGCGTAGEHFICPECDKKIKRIAEPYCKRCGRPLPPGVRETADCRECREAKMKFDVCRSVFQYQPPVDELVRKFKFSRNFAAGRRLMDGACEIALSDPEYFAGFDASAGIVPVPLHPFRYIRRGFNQSEYFSEGFSRMWSVEIMPCLIRRRHTRPQSLLPLKERAKNVRGAFSVRKNTALSGKRIILVDDVMTTGATIRECSRILKEAGAGEVYVLTIARRA